MLAASSTDARELEFFIENRLGGDSNVFRRSKNVQDELKPKYGGVWEISPRVTLRDLGNELDYDLRYQPTYERFFGVEGGVDDDRVSGIDHTAIGNLTWRIDQSSSLTIDGDFRRQRRLRENFIDAGIVVDPTLDASDNEFLERGRGSATIRQAVSPRISIQGTYSVDSFDISRQDQGDFLSHTGTVGVSYALTEKLILGVNSSYRQRDTRASIDPDGGGAVGVTEFRSSTQTTDVSFSLQTELSRNVRLDFAVGPSFFDTRDDRSTGEVTHTSDDSIFAAIGVTHGFKRGEFAARYTRSEGGGGGSASAAAIFDNVSLDASYRPSREWIFRARLAWTHRISLSSDAFFGLDTRSDLIALSGTVVRRLRPRLSLVLAFRYSWSEVDQSRPARDVLVDGTPPFVVTLPATQTSATTEVLSGFAGLRYTFDPYVF